MASPQPEIAPLTAQHSAKRLRWFGGAALAVLLLAGGAVAYFVQDAGPYTYRVSEGLCTRLDYSAFEGPFGLSGELRDSYGAGTNPEDLMGQYSDCQGKLQFGQLGVHLELPRQGEAGQWIANDRLVVPATNDKQVEVDCALLVTVQFSQCWRSSMTFLLRIDDGNLCVSVSVSNVPNEAPIRQVNKFASQLMKTMRETSAQQRP